MAIVFIPSLLRPLIREPKLDVPGTTIGEILHRMEALYPGVMAILVEDDDIKPGIAISINDQVGQMGLFDTVPVDAEIHFLPALSGGSGYLP